ncbi:MAG: hypothetical protein HYX41_00350 [Bdellovibrio sp.]|nr:hypothetical protein [Bdellovibrio sp.]
MNTLITTKLLKISWALIGGFAVFLLSGNSAYASNGSSIATFWKSTGHVQESKTWDLSEIEKLKRASSREKDPRSGKMIKWEGVLFSTFLDKVLDGLSVENRAQIDLVVVKGANGDRATIPRALITKYPLLLAYRSDHHSEVGNKRGLFSVVPWTTKPKIRNEDLPLETYFVPSIEQIELTSYRDRYSPFFLKRRTDPSAMRGEKLFVQNCTHCHSGGRPPVLRANQVETTPKKPHTGNSSGAGMAERLTEKDWKSIVRYLNAYVTENPVSAGGFFSGRSTAVK